MKRGIIFVIIVLGLLCCFHVNMASGEIWGVKTGEGLLGLPSTLFSFSENITEFTSIDIVTLDGSQIYVDGLAMSAEQELYGFHLFSGGSRLISINTADATATAAEVTLEGRDIRGAVITSNGNKLIALDAALDEIIEVNLATGGVEAVMPTPIFAGQLFDITNFTDIVQQTDGLFLIGQIDYFYLYNIDTGNMCLLFQDEIPGDGGYIVANVGLAFSSATPDVLFTFDANHYDDVYTYQMDGEFSREIIIANILPSYNAGRGDLAAVPIPIETVMTGDANSNGGVEMGDLDILAANWLGPRCGYGEGDFNLDGVVNLLDFVILAANWLTL